MDSLTETAWKIIDTVAAKKKPYAVFAGRVVELMPADGKRFAILQNNPQRMAQCVGVFDQRARLTEVRQALQAAMGGLCS